MSHRLRRLLIRASIFALAGVLLYLALRGIDTGAVVTAFRNADYRWLVPLAAVALGSHALRAWRWRVLLEALPAEDPSSSPESRHVPMKGAFYSVMIGYMVNYAAPRLGEVARTANLSSRQKLRFSSVFGTVVVEHLLDMVVTVLAVAVALGLLFDQRAFLSEQFVDPMRAQLASFPVNGWVALAAGLVAALGGLALLTYSRTLWRKSPTVSRLWYSRVRPALVSFKDGLLTLLRSRRRGALVLSTLAMWVCFLAMAYLPLVVFGMVESYGLGVADAWVLMTLAAIGVSIPSPGGIGSYHYITIQALVYLFDTPRAPAASYAVFVHAFQLVLYTLTGSLCLVLQGSSIRSLRQTTHAAPSTDASPEAEDERAKRPAGESNTSEKN